jgi:hypothetical protein
MKPQDLVVSLLAVVKVIFGVMLHAAWLILTCINGLTIVGVLSEAGE